MWDYHTEATKTVQLVLGVIQSLLKLVTISAFIAQPFLTLSSMRKAVLEHLRSLVGACKEPQAKQVCAVFTRGTEAPAAALVQSCWQGAACFPGFGLSWALSCASATGSCSWAGVGSLAFGMCCTSESEGPQARCPACSADSSGLPEWRSCGQRAGEQQSCGWRSAGMLSLIAGCSTE